VVADHQGRQYQIELVGGGVETKVAFAAPEHARRHRGTRTTSVHNTVIAVGRAAAFLP
jgi:hypothetical protein